MTAQMNDAVAMMFSILIVMFGYLVYKVKIDQPKANTKTTRTRKQSKGKPVIKNNWNVVCPTISPAGTCCSMILSYKFLFTTSETRVILNLAKKRLMSSFKTQKTPGCYPGAFCY